MKPVINKVNLTQLSKKQREKICECSEACDDGISLTTYNDGVIMCLGDARRHYYELNVAIGGNHYASWTESDERYIIELVRKKGTYRGINGDIAAALGKTYQQVRNKRGHMKKAGLL